MSTQDLSVKEYVEILKRAKERTENQEWAEASVLWERLVNHNPHVGSFWETLARARYEQKEYRAAVLAYEQAMKLGATYPWADAYSIASCYAQMGEREQALSWLERAFDLGLRSFSKAQTDANLTSLHDDPRFRQLVGLTNAEGMPRDEGWRYDLALLAREIRRIHYDPFRLWTEEDFDAERKRLHDSIPHLTDAEIFVGFKKLLRMAGDGHTCVTSVAEHPELRLAVPLQFYFFAEGLFIVAADPRFQDLLGAEVLRFGDRTLDDAMIALERVVSHDNEMSLRQFAQTEMRCPALLCGLGLVKESKRMPLTIRDLSGNIREISSEGEARENPISHDHPIPTHWLTLAEALAPGPIPLYLRNRNTAYWFAYLPEAKLVYFQFNKVRNADEGTIEQFSTRLFRFIDGNDVEKLVMDIRWNNGGNTFLVRPLIRGLIRAEKVNRDGHLFVIIGRKTFSAAQNTVTIVEQNTKAIFVGEPTGSSPNFVGEDVIVKLPYSKMEVSISDLYWQTSWPMDHRTWIAPTIYTPPSFDLYRTNRDPALEAILSY